MNSVARVDDDDSPNLRVLLARHDCQVSPTLFQLQRLRIALDVECLECSRIREDVDGLGERERQMTAPIEPDLIAPLIRHLSSSLNHSSYPGAARYREYQLRTLVSALALLHHRGVTALDADLYNGLYENIADRFRDLVCEGSRRGSSPSKVDACRHASALYLIRLALQYASLFNRREPKALQMAAPLTNLLLAGASVVGHQYGQAGTVLQCFDQILRLWRRPQTTFLTLPILQEQVRVLTTARHQAVGSTPSAEPENGRFRDVWAKLSQLIKTEMDYAPISPSGFWNWARVFTARGPPRLDRSYYLYGLLDCAEQMAHFLLPGTLSSALRQGFDALKLQSLGARYRSKVMQIKLSCPAGRVEARKRIANEIQQSPFEDRKEILEELDAAQAIMEEEDLCASDAMVCNGQASSMRTNECLIAAQVDLSELHRPHPVPCVPVAPSLMFDTPEVPEQAFQEDFESDPIEAEPFIHRINCGSRHRSKDFSSVGLSLDCSFVYLCRGKKLRIFPTAHIRDSVAQRRHNTPPYSKIQLSSPVRSVLCSQSVIALFTETEISFRSLTKPYGPLQAKPTRDRGWVPLDFALFERERRLTISIVQTRSNHEVRVTLRMYHIRNQDLLESSAQDLVWSGPGRPRKVAFNEDGQMLACLANAGEESYILVWQRVGDSDFDEDPIQVTEYSYTRETHRGGITSMSFFTSPSNTSYLLCTTSPSSERYRNGGEWSFVVPIPSRGYTVPAYLKRPLRQFGERSQLLTGAVSRTAKIFSILDVTGEIKVLSLVAHENGGICGVDDGPHILSCGALKTLNTNPFASHACLRFDHSGLNLFAVDRTGIVVAVDFHRALRSHPVDSATILQKGSAVHELQDAQNS